MKRTVWFVLILCCFCDIAIAQGFSVRANIDSLAMFIGDQANITFSIEQRSDMRIVAPLFSDSIVNGLEIVNAPAIDTLNKGGMEQMTVNITYTVTSFDSALFYIPPFPFVNGVDTQYTNPLTLKVVNVPVDTTQQAITDIKAVYDPPFNWQLFFRIVIYVLLAAVLVVIVIFIVRKFRKKRITEQSDEIEVDPRLAHEIALEELERLRMAKLWQKNRIKEYYTELTDILRQYLKRRYGIDALESTSDEVIAAVKDLKLPQEQSAVEPELKKILSIADLVKFAKYVPLEDENDGCFNKTVQIVVLTKENTSETVESENEKGNESQEN